MGVKAGCRVALAATQQPLEALSACYYFSLTKDKTAGMRYGFQRSRGRVRTSLAEDRFSGYVFVSCGRRGNMTKMLWWSGDGLCCWPSGLSVVAWSGRRFTRRLVRLAHIQRYGYRGLQHSDRLTISWFEMITVAPLVTTSRAACTSSICCACPNEVVVYALNDFLVDDASTYGGAQ